MAEIRRFLSFILLVFLFSIVLGVKEMTDAKRHFASICFLASSGDGVEEATVTLQSRAEQVPMAQAQG